MAETFAELLTSVIDARHPSDSACNECGRRVGRPRGPAYRLVRVMAGTGHPVSKGSAGQYVNGLHVPKAKRLEAIMTALEFTAEQRADAYRLCVTHEAS